MLHLTSITKNQKQTSDKYPLTVPLVQNLDSWKLTKPVTILIGENGTGKSTLLELIATTAGSISIGGDDSYEDSMQDWLKLTWTNRTKKGFYFKAREYSDFIQRLKTIKQETRDILQEIEARDPHSWEALPHRNTLADLQRLYGEGLEFRSHGESFLDLFQVRFQPGGLYLLDEPEAPLSPSKQLTLIAMMKDMIKERAQFIIATHSPLLMAFPEADLLEIQHGHLVPTTYEEVEHVTLTRDFLNDPERYLRHL